MEATQLQPPAPTNGAAPNGAAKTEPERQYSLTVEEKASVDELVGGIGELHRALGEMRERHHVEEQLVLEDLVNARKIYEHKVRSLSQKYVRGGGSWNFIPALGVFVKTADKKEQP